MENYRKLVLLASTVILTSMANGADVSDCLEINNNKDRLKCYDKAFKFVPSSGPKSLDLEIQTIRSVERPSAIVEETTKVQSVVPSDTKTLTAAQDAYDNVIANSQTLKITGVSQSRSRKTYYFTDSGRVFLKNTDRRATFKENDSVTLELGFLGSLFMTNQDDVRIKVKEMKVKD
jgi:uncharacterized ParB-like nuclease family protein